MRWCPRLASPSVPTATSRRPSSSRSRASPWLLRTSLGAPCGIMVRYSRDPQNDVKCTLRCTMGCCVIVGVMVLLFVSLAWRLLTLIASVICMVAAVLWLLRARCGSVTPFFAPPVSWVWSLRLALHAWRIRACAGQATHGTCGNASSVEMGSDAPAVGGADRDTGVPVGRRRWHSVVVFVRSAVAQPVAERRLGTVGTCCQPVACRRECTAARFSSAVAVPYHQTSF